MKRLLLVASCALGIALSGITGGTAYADAVDDAVSGLRGSALYVDQAATNPIDESGVLDAIGDAPILIAVLPEDAGDPYDAALRIGETLPGHTVAVVAGNTIRAGSDIVCAGYAGDVATRAVTDNQAQLQADGDVTALLVSFVAGMQGAPDLSSCPSAQNDIEAGASTASTGSSHAWLWFAGIGVLGLAGVGGYAVSRKRKQAQQFEGLRAEIMSYYNRLAADVSNLDPGGDPVTQQAIADASERYTSTGALLDEADTVGEFAAARRAVLEGLIAARTARGRLGLDLGPDLPPLDPPEGEQLDAPRTVTVGDQSFEGHPQYTPGARYHYRGGNGIPGGWYASPFWEGWLLGSVLGGRRGYGGRYGGRNGGGYGRGYGAGYSAGERADDGAAAGGGGSWTGGGGGGDWGGSRRGGGRGGGGSWGGGRGFRSGRGGGGRRGGGGSW